MGKTTFELIEEYIDIENMCDIISVGQIIEEGSEEQQMIQTLHLKRNEVLDALLQKVDNIDAFVLGIEERIVKLRAVKDMYKDEVERINKKLKSIGRIKDTMNKSLIPAVIRTIGKDNKIQTSSANYTMYKGWGKMLYDPDKVPETYKYVEEIPKIDTKKLKADAIALQKDGSSMEGVTVIQEDRIRRS